MLIVCAAALTSCASQPDLQQRDLSSSARANDERLIVIAVHNEHALARARAGSTLRGYSSADNYSVSISAKRALLTLAADHHLQPLAEWPIDILEMQCVVFQIADGVDRDQLIAQLNADNRVELAQPLQSFFTESAAVSGDPYAGMQRDFAQMSLAAAHLQSVGKDVRIAVVDTGIDSQHPDLIGRVDKERNFVDSDPQQFHNDRHGTAVAGVIAASKDNGVGVVGIAPEAKLLALKACWQVAVNSAARCNSYTLAQALAAAIELRAQVINLSLTGPADPLLSALVNRAQAAGIVVVGAGNSATTAGFPGSSPHVIKVVRSGTTAAADTLNAPGSEVLTLAPNGRYDFASGDSIATAVVSGVVALLKSVRQSLDAAQITQLLNQSANLAHSNASQASTINACHALATLTGVNNCREPRIAETH
jgi:subtilisin family serine protease